MTDYERELLSKLVTLNAEIKDLTNNNPVISNYIKLKRNYDNTEADLKNSMGELEYHKMCNGFRQMFAPKN